MLDDFILGDRIALVMGMSIVQVLSVEGEADVRIAYRLHSAWMYIPDSFLAQHSRDEPSYMSPRHNLSRFRGRGTKGRSVRCRSVRKEEAAEANVPSVGRRQRSGYVVTVASLSGTEIYPTDVKQYGSEDISRGPAPDLNTYRRVSLT